MILTPENEAKINAEFDNLVAGFKPVFGNDSHLHFVKLIERARHDEALLKKHTEAMKSTAVYRKKTFEAKTRAISSLKFIMEKENAMSGQTQK